MADYRMGSSVQDAALQYIIDNCDRQVAMSADPVNYAGVAAVTLAAANMVSGDFSISAGDVNGRKLTIGAKASITPSANGTATHIALVDDTLDEILLMVPIPATALVTTTPTNFASWEHETRDNEAG